MNRMPIFILYLIVSLSFAEIRTGEIVLRLGEVIDFDSGTKKVVAVDTVSCILQTPDCEKAVCRHEGSDRYDAGFFFNGYCVDCFGAPPEENCSECLKAIFSSSRIYRFTQNDFFKGLNSPVDTTETVSLSRYQSSRNAAFYDDSGTAVSCTVFEGPEVSVLCREGDPFFLAYYYLVTDKGHGCIFTIVKRETVDEYCNLDTYNALIIKYYLQTDTSAIFSSIAEDIRDRLASGIRKGTMPHVCNIGKDHETRASTFDLLGRIHSATFPSSAMKIRRTGTYTAGTLLLIQ